MIFENILENSSAVMSKPAWAHQTAKHVSLDHIGDFCESSCSVPSFNFTTWMYETVEPYLAQDVEGLALLYGQLILICTLESKRDFTVLFRWGNREWGLKDS